jgi:hypothetical protein
MKKNGVLKLAAVMSVMLAIGLGPIATHVMAAPGDIVDFHSLVGNVGGPAPGSPVVAGVSPAGAAWEVGSSEVDLSGSGLLTVSIQGLFLISTGTVGSVTSVQAVLACQTGTSTWTYVTTTPVSLSTSGDATISQTITLPTPCYAPIVLIEKGAGTTYFATTGYSTSPPSDIADFYSMIGNIGGASPGSPVVAGINPAGAAWVISAATATIDASGQLSVSVQGLVIQSTGMADSGTLMVEAQLACQTVTSGVTSWTYAITSPVPLSIAGNAMISQTITLPSSPCYDPIILVTHQGATGAYSYFAATGYSTAGNPQGVPQFPLGLAAVFLVLAPLLILVRRATQPHPMHTP